jgi:putative transposase
LRTLYWVFATAVTPASAAAATGGDRARRAKLVYLRRRGTHRNQVWEGDHKNLPIVVLPPRGPATTPWVTMFTDDATRAIVGWAISLTPHAGTVLTALRMGMLADDTGPACALTVAWSSLPTRSGRPRTRSPSRCTCCPPTTPTAKARSNAPTAPSTRSC